MHSLAGIERCADGDHFVVRLDELLEECILVLAELAHNRQCLRVVQQMHVARQLEVGTVWWPDLFRQILLATILEPQQVLEVAAVSERREEERTPHFTLQAKRKDKDEKKMVRRWL